MESRNLTENVADGVRSVDKLHALAKGHSVCKHIACL